MLCVASVTCPSYHHEGRLGLDTWIRLKFYDIQIHAHFNQIGYSSVGGRLSMYLIEGIVMMPGTIDNNCTVFGVVITTVRERERETGSRGRRK